MAYDCRFQTTIRDHVPSEYYHYIANEKKSDVKLPEEKRMFLNKCMSAVVYKSSTPTQMTVLLDKSQRNGLRHSVFNYQKDSYVGEWKNDKKDGHGSYQARGGKVLYEGEWINGKRDGYGILSEQGDQKRNKIKFEGFWKEGKPQGKGSQFGKDGSYYEGLWVNGVRQGFGRMWYADGSFYEGTFHRNKREGKGLFVYIDGNRYIGEWNDNFKHGFGAFYHMTTGQIQMGHWIRNNCINSWMFDMKYRGTVQHPTDYSIPEKAQVLKQLKRYSKLQETKSDFRNASTQTDE